MTDRLPILRSPPTYADLDYLAAHMREMDRVECDLMGGDVPREVLAQCVRDADWAYVAEVDGKPVCVFGMTTQDVFGGIAAPWFLAAEGIERHARALLQLSPAYINRMKGGCERLFNLVHAHNRSAIRYLKWCGFTMGDKVDVKGQPFILFEMRMN